MRRNFIINLTLAAALIAATLLATYVLDGHKPLAGRKIETAVKTAATLKAPDVVLIDMEGRKSKLSDYRGKVILLNFWASWCLPCKAEFRQFATLARALPDDLVILAVSVDEEKKNIDAFLKNHAGEIEKIPNIVIFQDPLKKVAQDTFHSVRVPETVIIDPGLMMRDKVAGLAVEWDSENIIAQFRTMAKNQR